MKVGLFVELYRPYLSGVTVSVDSLAAYLQKKGEVFLFAPFVPGYQDETDWPVFRLPSFPLAGYHFALPWVSSALVKEVEKLHLDLIHLQGPYPTGLVGAKLAQKLRLPLVMTFHTEIFLYLKAWTNLYNWPLFLPSYLLARWAIRYLGRRCQLILAPSEFTKKNLERLKLRKIEVLPTPIKPPLCLADQWEARRKLNLPFAPLILYTGRLAKEKNLFLLVSAFQEVLKKHPCATLVLVGDGPLRLKLEKECAFRGLSQRVIFAGQKEPALVWEYLRAADLFAFPSTTETQGLSVSEAMAAGLPTVVTDQGGAKERICHLKDGLVARADKEAFASALNILIENPHWRSRLGSEAQKKSDQLEPDRLYQRLIDFYRQVIRPA